MPILVKDFTWEESEETVRITVPLKGVKPNKVDIFSTEEYIKVSLKSFKSMVILTIILDIGIEFLTNFHTELSFFITCNISA